MVYKKSVLFLLFSVLMVVPSFSNGPSSGMQQKINQSLKQLGITQKELEQNNWPHFRGPEGTGFLSSASINIETIMSKEPLWKLDVGQGYAAPSIQGALLYIVGNISGTDYIRCLNAFTGEEFWNYSYSSRVGQYPGPRSSPTIVGDVVYVLSREGELIALNRFDGQKKFHINIRKEYGVGAPSWSFSSSVVYHQDMLLINAGAHGIALNPENGAKIWGREGTGGYATPIVYKDQVLMFGRNKLFAVDLESGEALWNIPWTTSYDVNAADPLVFDDKVFLSSGYSKGAALYDISSGTPVELWKTKNMSSHFPSMIYTQGMIIGMDGGTFNSRGGKITALNPEDGSILWSERTGFGSFFMAGKQLVMTVDNGKLVFGEVNGGFTKVNEKRVTRPLVWTAPVLAHGFLYIKNARGELIAIDAR